MDETYSGSARQAVAESLALLTPRDRSRFRLVVVAQSVTGLLDLAGVLLLAVVALLLTSVAQGQATTGLLESGIEKLGLQDVPLVTLATLLAGIACLFLITKSVIYTFLLRRIYRFLGARQASISTRLVEDLFSSPLVSIEKRSTQEIAYAVVIGVFAATGGVLGSFAIVVSEAVLMVLLATALLLVDPLVSLVAIGLFFLVGLFIHRSLSGRITRYGSEIGSTVVLGTELIQESVSFFREIQVLGRKPYFISELRTVLTLNAGARSDALFYSQLPKIVYEVTLVLGALGVAAWQFSTKPVPLAVATLVLFMTAASRILPSMLRLTGQILIIKHSAAQASQAFDLADEIGGASQAEDALNSQAGHLLLTSSDFEATLVVAEVSVCYPGSKENALTGVSFCAPAGSSVAVVGTTGAGKSTLADVLLGILQADSGQVLIGGMAPSNVIQKHPGMLAYVPQEVGMTNGSIRENVALGLPPMEVSDDQVWEALEKAHLADFLRVNRQGLDTPIGERGVSLSGGQRQRLGLARALLSQPRMLVLDEATSALDAETEAAVSDTIHNLAGRVTTVVVAHRLATIRDSDLVVYLRNGRVAACGSFDAVRADVPEFDRQASLLGLH